VQGMDNDTCLVSKGGLLCSRAQFSKTPAQTTSPGLPSIGQQHSPVEAVGIIARCRFTAFIVQ
jgi:hypothetical protein